MLIYYCSTGYKEIHVMNGNEKGSSVSSISSFDIKNIKQKHQVFMDNATGDVYEYFHVRYYLGKVTVERNCKLRITSGEVCRSFWKHGDIFQKA